MASASNPSKYKLNVLIAFTVMLFVFALLQTWQAVNRVSPFSDGPEEGYYFSIAQAGFQVSYLRQSVLLGDYEGANFNLQILRSKITVLKSDTKVGGFLEKKIPNYQQNISDFFKIIDFIEADIKHRKKASVLKQIGFLEGKLLNLSSQGRELEMLQRSHFSETISHDKILLSSIAMLLFLFVAYTIVFLNNSIKQSKRLNNERILFVASIAHDLKSPLQSILNVVELLNNHLDGQAESKRLVEQISISAAEITNQSDNLMEFSKLESGVTTLNIVKTSVGIMMRELQNEFELLELKNTNLKFVGLVNILEPYVSFDAFKVRLCARNLIENAIKHSQAQNINVEYYVSHGHFSIEVSDDGIGIDAHEMELIFKPFQQVGKTKKFGMGMGLYIVKHFVDAMGGTIQTKSSKQGTSFFVTIPLSEEG